MYTQFPLWIELSGLPAHLADTCKTPLAWVLFKKIVELDIARNRTPSVVEISFNELAQLTGIEPDKIESTLKKMRKAGVMRFFLPDNAEEDALFEVITPLVTPVSWQDVRKATPELFQLQDHQFRYATAATAEVPLERKDGHDPRLKEVIDLYLNNVSMKMNSFILDELRLIAARFDLPMVRKVFARARTKEVQSLSWILKEIRLEQKIKEGRDSKSKQAT